MRGGWLFSLGLVATVFGGCISDGDGTLSDLEAPMIGPKELFAGPALYPDPQNTPHPFFNWPTLSNPTTGDAPAFWQPAPAAALPATITGIEPLATTDGIDGGAGISIFGSIAVVPGSGDGTSFVDISDPSAPRFLSTTEAGGRGSAIIAYPDGRLIAVLSTGSGFNLVDFTDPENPDILAPVEPSGAGHKLGVVPGTPLVYNAASWGGTTTPLYGPGPGQLNPMFGEGYTEIYDLSDPEAPVLVQEFQNGYACHHIFFWLSLEESKYRAICAGLQYTQIWDIEDPYNPKVLVSIPVHYGIANGPSTMASILAFSHSAGLNMDGTVLYVGDESGGGGIPPGCVASANTPAGAVSTPVGATWFYDVSDEMNPLLLGYYSPLNDIAANPAGSCTTHHGRIVPVEGRDLLAMSYYKAGVILVDFTDIGRPGGPLPRVVDQFNEGTSTWETWYYQGYLVLGDGNLGLQTLSFT